MKSLLILCTGLLSGCEFTHKIDRRDLSPMGGDPVKTGRFELKQLGEMRRDQYLLDTATGRVWQPVCTELTKDGIGCEGEKLFKELTVESR